MKKRISAVLLALAMLFTTAHAIPIYVDGSAMGCHPHKLEWHGRW